MKPGQEYEKFVYDKFKTFFQAFDVTLNDKIIGEQSGIKREIDISIKGKSQGLELLYLTQCKDHNKPADIKIIGEFSSVIKDVGGSKGFLICSSGFAKTIHQYAKTLGIELITVEDINSEKWKANVEIPIIYIKKRLQTKTALQIQSNEALKEKNKSDIQVSNKDFDVISFDGGKTAIKLLDVINDKVQHELVDVSKEYELDLNGANLMLFFSGIWVYAAFKISFSMENIHYLKYVRPDEYSHILDHVKKETVPLSVTLKELGTDLDETYIEINGSDIPIFAGFSFEIEENLFPLQEFNIKSISFANTTY